MKRIGGGNMNSPKFLGCYDDPDVGFASNIYLSDENGDIFVERVWSNEGVTVIGQDGSTYDMRLTEFREMLK